jgi:hypothetical protein
MTPPARWWPDNLGDPSSSGAQDGTRYVFFQRKKLLLVEHSGKLQRFQTGEHRIIGVSQVSGGGALTFTSERGPISLEDLEEVLE